MYRNILCSHNFYLSRCRAVFNIFYYILKSPIPQDAITHYNLAPARLGKGAAAVILPVQLILCGQFDGSLYPFFFFEIRGQPGTIFPGQCLPNLIDLRRIFQRADGQGRCKNNHNRHLLPAPRSCAAAGRSSGSTSLPPRDSSRSPSPFIKNAPVHNLHDINGPTLFFFLL